MSLATTWGGTGYGLAFAGHHEVGITSCDHLRCSGNSSHSRSPQPVDGYARNSLTEPGQQPGGPGHVAVLRPVAAGVADQKCPPVQRHGWGTTWCNIPRRGVISRDGYVRGSPAGSGECRDARDIPPNDQSLHGVCALIGGDHFHIGQMPGYVVLEQQPVSGEDVPGLPAHSQGLP